jgi:hypothetical protein
MRRNRNNVPAMRWAFIVTVAVVAGCAAEEPQRLEFHRDAVLASFQPVTYHRTGGIIGTDDHLTIDVDGTVRTHGRLFADATMRLSEFQIMQLVRLFEEWQTLADSYPAQAVDAFTVEIAYGQKRVVVSDASAGVPAVFTRVRDRLESLATQMIRAAN